MVDKIRKIFSKKEDENGHPVGYAEDAVSKLHIDNMPVAIQKVDSWLRQHVPMKGTEEDCLYCKLISCSVLSGVTVYILRQAPKTMRTYQNRSSKIVYGSLVTGLLTCVSGLAIALWFDISIPDQNKGDNTSVSEQVQQIFINGQQKKMENWNKKDMKTEKDRNR